jgi:hypothetical protein
MDESRQVNGLRVITGWPVVCRHLEIYVAVSWGKQKIYVLIRRIPQYILKEYLDNRNRNDLQTILHVFLSSVSTYSKPSRSCSVKDLPFFMRI